jgi:hypothetical protein
MAPGTLRSFIAVEMAVNYQSRFENALRNAVRRDTMAEMNEEWAPAKLKALEGAWAEAKAARAELEAKITEAIRR